MDKINLNKNDYISFWELGRSILEIASVRFGSMIIPCFETMKPNNLPSVTMKMDFLGLREIPNFLHLSNSLEIVEDHGHRPLKRSSGIFKAERHFSIRKCSPRTNKCGLMLVLGLI